VISLLIAAQLMANPCMIVHTHKAHHTPQQSVVCPVMPPCGKETTNGDITPIYPIPYGYLHVSDMPPAPLDTTAVGAWLAPGWQTAPGPSTALPNPVYLPPRTVQQTPELETEGYFAAATLLLLALLCTLTKRRQS